MKTVPLLLLEWLFCDLLCCVCVYTQNLRGPAEVVAVTLWAASVRFCAWELWQETAQPALFLCVYGCKHSWQKRWEKPLCHGPAERWVRSSSVLLKVFSSCISLFAPKQPQTNKSCLIML